MSGFEWRSLRPRLSGVAHEPQLPSPCPGPMAQGSEPQPSGHTAGFSSRASCHPMQSHLLGGHRIKFSIKFQGGGDAPVTRDSPRIGSGGGEGQRVACDTGRSGPALGSQTGRFRQTRRRVNARRRLEPGAATQAEGGQLRAKLPRSFTEEESVIECFSVCLFSEVRSNSDPVSSPCRV